MVVFGIKTPRIHKIVARFYEARLRRSKASAYKVDIPTAG